MDKLFGCFVHCLNYTIHTLRFKDNITRTKNNAITSAQASRP